MIQQFLGSTGALVRGDKGNSNSKLWMVTEQQTAGYTSPNPWNRIAGESQPSPEKDTISCPGPVLKPTEHTGTALQSHSFLTDKPSASHRAKETYLGRQLPCIKFSPIKEIHSYKSFHWLKVMHTALKCIAALLFLFTLIRIYKQQWWCSWIGKYASTSSPTCLTS